MKILKSFFASLLILTSTPVQAELLGEEWITEAEMKKQSAFARQNRLLLVGLNCKFNEEIKDPQRNDVLFRADFKLVETPQAWGWTFDANAQLRGPEEQSKSAGFVVATEDYFELTGVTWVRCKVWHRP